MAMICHQRQIRDMLAAEQPRPAMSSLAGCRVAAIDLPQARRIILTYEWLGTMGRPPAACYGLLDCDDTVIGALTFSSGPNHTRERLLGKEHAAKVICLERGACVHWAHQHAASFLIGRAVRLAAATHGWEVFYAYSDEAAGDIGTVYQATNWLYFGKGPGATGRNGFRVAIQPPGVADDDLVNHLSTRELRRGKLGRLIDDFIKHNNVERPNRMQIAQGFGYRKIWRHEKHFYVLPARHRQRWLRLLEAKGWTPRDYPKRPITLPA
jgi:hypothetical protein